RNTSMYNLPKIGGHVYDINYWFDREHREWEEQVSLMFDDFNIPVIDADKIAREVVEPGERAYQDIVDHFGKEILRSDMTLDREKLGEIVFSDEQQRKVLNGIVHPAIRKEMLQRR